MFDNWWPVRAGCARRASRRAICPITVLLALARLQGLCLGLLPGATGGAGGATARGQAVLEGFLSVSAALLARNRRVDAVLVRRAAPGDRIARLAALARAAGVPLRRVDDVAIARYAAGSSHGGIVALVGPRRFLPLDALLAGRRPFVAMLDGLEDPYNFGHAVRALYAAGVDGLVVRPRDWLPVDGTIARASAGTTELLPTAVAADLADAAACCKARGLAVVCAAQGREAVPMYSADLAGPLCLVLGGERRGVGRALLGQADVVVRIPYGRAFARSLGLTAAAAALAFEVARQRRRHDAR
ncbi:MAG TPA: TrmH family RNA methyltransferase [Thermomicrobiales bacterium]|nr:TrmH family RNA methyltransferase [Thermomicrobiales bacterium]